MDDAGRQPGPGRSSAAHGDGVAPAVAGDVPNDVDLTTEQESASLAAGGEEDLDETLFDETLFEETSALIDDGRNYVEAEIAFQKIRAKLAGRLAGASLGLVVLALILLHIALLALAVGLVIALAPLVTIWGAILIVVGALLLAVGLLGWMAMKRAEKLGALFSDPDDGDAG